MSVRKSYIIQFSRVYSDEARHELELLKTTWLIDEFEQKLKSVQDYEKSLEQLLHTAPELKEYLSHFVAVITGDYPTWKYNKKIIAKVAIEPFMCSLISFSARVN